MNKKMIGILLAAATVLTTVCLTGSLGEELAQTVGKAIWYVPYALLIASIRFFKAAI